MLGLSFRVRRPIGRAAGVGVVGPPLAFARCRDVSGGAERTGAAVPFPLSFHSAFAASLALCLCTALLEGLFAGRNVKATFARLRFPRYSLPLPAWIVLGVA